MPPKKLTDDEEAFVAHWSRRQFYFMKMMRRADLFIRNVPRETHKAAYKEVATSEFVVGGEWDNPNKNDERIWHPKREDREAYVEYMEDVIRRHSIESAKNAVTISFAANGGAMVIMGSIVMDRPVAVRDRFWDEVHKLNNADLEATKEQRRGPDKNIPDSSAQNPIDRDPDEDPNYEPFVRSRPLPQDPVKRISPTEWKRIGETYFVRDEAGFTAFELTGIIILKTGTSYKIRYENCVDSFRITEKDLLAMVEDGVWV